MYRLGSLGSKSRRRRPGGVEGRVLSSTSYTWTGRTRTGRRHTEGPTARLTSDDDYSVVDDVFDEGEGAGVDEEEEGELLRLNVGGQSFVLRADTIAERAPNARLACFVADDHEHRLATSDGFLNESAEYFFERSPYLFGVVYRFYISGLVYKPTEVCDKEFLEELIYWRLTTEESDYRACVRRLRNKSNSLVDPTDQFHGVRLMALRRKLWNLSEEPSSSLGAQVFASCSVLFVLISIAGLVAGSIPALQVPVPVVRASASVNGTTSAVFEPHPAFEYVEAVCMIWFTGEYLLKLTVTARRCAFFLRLMNLVDVAAISPYYIELSLHLAGVSTSAYRDLQGAMLVIRVLRVARVVRVFKLGRYSSGLQTFAHTMRRSMRQLGMMSMVLMTGVVFFSTLVYFLEKDEPRTHFTSIPAGFWWCIVTMTTVGYGDIVPITVGGKLVASGAIVSGVLVLALPITIIVDNFMKVAVDDDENIEENQTAV